MPTYSHTHVKKQSFNNASLGNKAATPKHRLNDPSFGMICMDHASKLSLSSWFTDCLLMGNTPKALANTHFWPKFWAFSLPPNMRRGSGPPSKLWPRATTGTSNNECMAPVEINRKPRPGQKHQSDTMVSKNSIDVQIESIDPCTRCNGMHFGS
eukprot:4278006-Amphidinium_carterae.1